MPKGLTVLLVFLCLVCFGTRAEERLCVNTDEGAFLMDTQGRVLPASQNYSSILTLQEDTLYAGVPKNSTDGRCALLDADGNALTSAQYDHLTAQNGGILFRRDRLCGILRPDGTELLGPAAHQIVATGDGYLALGSNPFDDAADEIIRVLPDGTLLDTATYVSAGLHPLQEERMRFTDARGREGFTDAYGEIVIPAQYDAVTDFENGAALFWKDGLCGVLNPDGEELLPAQWDVIVRTENAFGALKTNEGRTSVTLFDRNFTPMATFEEEGLSLAAVGRNFILEDADGKRVCAEDGHVLTRLPLSTQILAGAGAQLVLRTGTWGENGTDILAEDGTVLTCGQQHIYPLSDTLYVFCVFRTVRYNSALLGEEHLSTDYASMRFGLLDTTGATILEAEYTDISSLAHGYILLRNEESAAIAAADGSVLFCLN